MNHFYLIGTPCGELRPNVFPTNLDVLRMFCHFHKQMNLTVKESSAKTSEALIDSLQNKVKSGRDHRSVITSISSLYRKWELVKKKWYLQTSFQKAREAEFKNLLLKNFEFFNKKSKNTLKINSEFPVQNVPQQLEPESGEETDNDQSATYYPKHPVPGKSRVNLWTPSVTSALDRCGISARESVHVVAAIASSLGHNLNQFNLSRNSSLKQRERARSALATEIKAGFDPKIPLVVHWDGKMLPNLTGNERGSKYVDRLPIVVSGFEVDQLLAVPKLNNGGGKSAADAVHNALLQWKISDKVCGFSFDTTSVNTGEKNGAAVLLEKKLKKSVLFLPCRHHIFELVLEKVFSLTVAVSTSPEILIFKRFQSNWNKIDPKLFRTGTEDDKTKSYFSKEKAAELVKFAFSQLTEIQPRNDYKELLDLTLIFLGQTPPGGIRFKKPAGLHRARFMSRLIYSFKLFMFGRVKTTNESLFNLTMREENGVKEFLIFALVGGYIQAWFLAPHAISAPVTDVNFLKNLHEYSKINKTLSEAAVKKFLTHLSYLGGELIGLSFFDRSMPLEKKREMQAALFQKVGADSQTRKAKLKICDVGPNLELHQFINKTTNNFFQKLGLSTNFLSTDPEQWSGDEEYLEGEKIVQCLRVVNDSAERAVALIQQFNDKITNNEEQKQFLLQVVKEHRLKFPSSEKSVVIAGLQRK